MQLHYIVFSSQVNLKRHKWRVLSILLCYYAIYGVPKYGHMRGQYLQHQFTALKQGGLQRHHFDFW